MDRAPFSAALVAALVVAGCASISGREAAPVEVRIVAINDLHGNLEPPGVAIDAVDPNGAELRVPAGGVAHLSSAVAEVRRAQPNMVVVSAGDLIGASPLISAGFLDEPTIHAMNLMGLDIAAVGNHEFDRGRAELLRIKHGGCERHARAAPCRIEPFRGAKADFLAANTVTESGATLFPATAIRSFGRGARAVRIGFVGLTLKGTSSLVSQAGIRGLSFRDEADTANALVPKLRAAGADAIVVVIHQGLFGEEAPDPKKCAGFTGDLLPILARLSPEVDLVVSGHTHRAYVCDHAAIDPARPFLVTSAGVRGTLFTNIRLAIDPASGRVVAKSAENVIVQGEGFREGGREVAVSDRLPRFAPEPRVAALIARYAEAAAPVAGRVVGRLSASATRDKSPTGEQALGNLIADAQLAATRAADKGGAKLAIMNADGVRADLVPQADGSVTYGQLFAVQPFANMLVTQTMTGAAIRRALEQQFIRPGGAASPRILLVSSNVAYAINLSRPEGGRILDLRIGGAPVDEAATYRVTTNSYLAGGGDDFTAFKSGADPLVGAQDIDALEAYFASAPMLRVPAADRTRKADPGR